MNIRKQIRTQRLQDKSRMVGKSFNVLNDNERRAEPWLGSGLCEIGNEEELKQFVEQWHVETERLLKLNPNLKII